VCKRRRHQDTNKRRRESKQKKKRCRRQEERRKKRKEGRKGKKEEEERRKKRKERKDMVERQECSGRGECLEQGSVRRSPCKFNCVLCPCPNAALCKTVVPQWVLDCHDGRCCSCNMSFGEDLVIRQDLKNYECPVCLEETSMNVKMPGCVHTLCAECFHRLYFGPQREYPGRAEEKDAYYAYEDALTAGASEEEIERLVMLKEPYEQWLSKEEDLAELEQEEEGETPSKKCPLCRHQPVPKWMTKDMAPE